MTTTPVLLPTQKEIEALYAGEIGDQYLAKHPLPDPKREPFWRAVIEETNPKSVLEVGVGSGGNLAHMLSVPMLYGIDVHQGSLDQAKINTQGKAKLYKGSATALPLPQRSVDLVFTAGCLIHISVTALARVLKEMGRVSDKYVLMVEYVDSHRREIPWRGHSGILFADRFPLEFWRHNPMYKPVWRRSLGSELGFDRCEGVLFCRREGM